MKAQSKRSQIFSGKQFKIGTLHNRNNVYRFELEPKKEEKLPYKPIYGWLRPDFVLEESYIVMSVTNKYINIIFFGFLKRYKEKLSLDLVEFVEK